MKFSVGQVTVEPIVMEHGAATKFLVTKSNFEAMGTWFEAACAIQEATGGSFTASRKIVDGLADLAEICAVRAACA